MGPVLSGVVVPSLVAGWGERVPGAVAVSGPGGSVSYGELVARADRLAGLLAERGAVRGEVVGVCLDRDVPLVVALLGVMRAGCAYLPLDPAYPGSRLRFMVQDAGARLVVGGDLVPPEVTQIAELVEVPACGGGGGGVLPPVEPGDLAYVIYTSGSTGTPKGVAVEHGSAARLFDRVGERIDWTPADVWSCYHSAAFDFSVWEIWGALTSGGQVVMVSHADSRDPVAFRGLLEERGITMLSLTPTALLRLMPHLAGGAVPSRLRHLLLGGEAVRPGQIGALLSLPVPARPRIWNLYGITETTVHATIRELTARDADAPAGSPIGAPLADLVFAVVGEDGTEVTAGEPGELWIAGAGVARGYVNRPELTAQRFVDAAVAGVQGRWYRTGDAVRAVAPGEFDYIGRLDRQVKLRGFRIELGEIEAALEAHDGVSLAAAELDDDGDGPRLTAFLTLTGNGVQTAEDLREWLSTRLPDHMLPTTFSVVADIPVTENGKLDRPALHQLTATPLPARTPTAEPTTETEQILAAIWSEVLGKTHIGRNDDFFTIGGNSMSALRVAMVAGEEGLALGVRDLFAYPVLADLAAALVPLAVPAPPPGGRPPAAAGPHSDPSGSTGTDVVQRSYPALRIQAGMLFESERDPDRPTYHVVSETTLNPPELSRHRLAAALAAVVAAQPGLRTGFDLVSADGPVQLVRGLASPALHYEDLAALAAGELDQRLNEIRRTERERPFNRDDFPLWRLTCAVLPGGRARLFLSHHHALLDGWSVAVFFDQLLAALSGDVVESPADVCELAAEAEARALASAESARHWSGIARQWRALAVRSRHRQDGEPATWTVTRPIDGHLRNDIKRACIAWRCSAKWLFLAAHLRAIELRAGPGARPPGTVVVANARPEVPGAHLAIGVFLNAVPVPPADPGAAWPDRVEHVAAAERAMLDHRHFPYASMRSQFGLPDPTTWFTYTNFAGTSMAEFLASVIDHNITELPLTVSVVDDGLLLDGSSDHFTSADVAEIADAHMECLREAVRAALAADEDPGESLLVAANPMGVSWLWARF
jgi:amino acid adenylation domain-containing protein